MMIANLHQCKSNRISGFAKVLLAVHVVGCSSGRPSCDTHVDQAGDDNCSSFVQASLTTRKESVDIDEQSAFADLGGRSEVARLAPSPNTANSMHLGSENNSSGGILRAASNCLVSVRVKMQELLQSRSRRSSSVQQLVRESNPVRTMFLYAVALLLILVVFFIAALGLGFIPPRGQRSCHGQQAQQRQGFFARDKTAQQMHQPDRNSTTVSLKPEAYPPERHSQHGSPDFGQRASQVIQAHKRTTKPAPPQPPPPQQTGGSLIVTPPPSGRVVAGASAKAGGHPSAGSSTTAVIAKSPGPYDKVQDSNANHHLCPELVVPDGSECTLLVPRLPPRGSAEDGQVTVDDARGVPVFNAKYTLGDHLRRDAKRLILTSANGDAVFAFCRDEADAGRTAAGPGLTLHHHFETPFGVIRPEGRNASGGYVVVTRRGYILQFRGDMKAGHLNATDEHGRLLGISEQFGAPGSGRRSMRIGPLVDAGLIALTLLGIDLLEYEAASASSASSGRRPEEAAEASVVRRDRKTASHKLC